ncbi:hypothetical protein [Shinella pollutisoli]|uniref:Uncharacterized protein n=1 Tax=Shinella pollutisoli TaxID=2250594 RepID=A0ABV7DG93_9HYPH|nr:hypothetical protein [Shinella pollutisoli]
MSGIDRTVAAARAENFRNVRLCMMFFLWAIGLFSMGERAARAATNGLGQSIERIVNDPVKML